MKVDLVITELNVGGAEKAITRLALGLQQRGHDARVLSIGSAPVDQQAALKSRLEAQSIPVLFGNCDSARRFFAAGRWLAAQLRSRQADVCQTFLFHANCLGAYAGRIARIPCVVGGIRVAEERVMRSFIESQALRRIDHVVCVSDAVRDFANKTLSIAPSRLTVIPNGTELVDPETCTPFDWGDLGFPPSSRVLLFVGRMHPQKGIELLQQQWQRLASHDPDLRLVLIGQGPLQSEIDDWISHEGRGRVRRLPFQSDIVPYLLASELLVLPSHYEGMANVVLEAMAVGKAVVCSRIEGTAELFPAIGQAGDHPPERSLMQTFSRADGNAMTTRICELLDDADRRNRLGEANRSFVRQQLTVDRMVDRYEALYRTLLRQRV